MIAMMLIVFLVLLLLGVPVAFSLGIPTMIYYPRGMHQQGAFADLPYALQCPNTEKLCRTVLALPMHPYLEETDVEAICKAVLENL